MYYYIIVLMSARMVHWLAQLSVFIPRAGGRQQFPQKSAGEEVTLLLFFEKFWQFSNEETP